MTPIDIAATESTPAVRYDPAAAVLRIEGESFPEDVVAFYGPVVEWLRDHLAARPPALVVQLAFRYLNTSSTKAVLDLLLLLDEHHRSGAAVTVQWHYDPAIEVMREAGEELGEDLALPFRLAPLS